MTRISDIGLQQILLQNFQRAQNTLQANQIALSSGAASQTYSGYGADALRLISAKGVVTRVDAYEKAGQIALTRLETQETALTTIADAVDSARQNITRILATGASERLGLEIEVAAQRILGALNRDLGGVYLFGGNDGAVPPLNASTLEDLGASSSIDALFTEGARMALTVEEGVTIDGGPLASEVARDLLGELQEFATVESRLGAFQGDLTDAQRDFVVEKLANLGDIAANLIEQLGLNGISQFQAADAVQRNRQARDYAEIVAADIESVDIAEVITRIDQDQLAIEASARALAQASELSLLNFL